MSGVVERIGAVSVVEKKGYLYLRASLPVYSPLGAFEKLASRWITLGMRDDGSKGKNRQLAILRAKELDYDLSRFRAGIPFPLSKWDSPTPKESKKENHSHSAHSTLSTFSSSSSSLFSPSLTLSFLSIYQEFYRHKTSGVRPNTMGGYNAYLHVLQDIVSFYGDSYLAVDSQLGGRIVDYLVNSKSLSTQRVKQYLSSYSNAYQYCALSGVGRLSQGSNPFLSTLESLSILSRGKKDKATDCSASVLSPAECSSLLHAFCYPYLSARYKKERERKRESGMNEFNSFLNQDGSVFSFYLPDLIPVGSDTSLASYSTFKRLYIYGLFCQFSLLTGCRPCEGFAIRPMDIHLNDGQSQSGNGMSSYIEFSGIILRKTGRINGLKTQEYRKFPVNEQLATFLKYVLSLFSPTTCTLFPSKSRSDILFSYSNRVSYRSFATAWQLRMDKISQESGNLTTSSSSHLSPYSMRHTFITRCLQEGVPVADVAKWVGNSPSIIYKHYAAHNTSSVVPVL